MSKIVYEVTVDNLCTQWRLKELLHREDGPAVSYANGTNHWYLNGLAHREDGPAVERTNGAYDWYLNGKNYTQAEFKIEIARRKNTCDGKVVEIDGKKYTLTEYTE